MKPFISNLEYRAKKSFCHPFQFFILCIFCKKYNPVTPCIICRECIINFFLGTHCMKCLGIPNRSNLISCKVAKITPFCIIPVQEIFLWHKPNFINNTSFYHKRTCCNRVCIDKFRHTAIFIFIKIQSLCTEIFKINLLSKLLDIIRVFQMVYLGTSHPGFRMCFQEFI